MANLQLDNKEFLDSIKAQKRKKQVFLGSICASWSEYVGVKKVLLKERVTQHASEHGVMLVKVDDVPEPDQKGSVLTKRQKRWLNTTPYDSVTQNPVVYK